MGKKCETFTVESLSSLDGVLGISTSWPTTDIIEKLCEATDILLHRLDYDGDGWEVLQYAMTVGKERVVEINQMRSDLWKKENSVGRGELSKIGEGL